MLDRAVDAHLINLYRDLDMHAKLASAPTAVQLAQSLGFSDSAYIALQPLLKRLANRHDFISADGPGLDCSFTSHSNPEAMIT